MLVSTYICNLLILQVYNDIVALFHFEYSKVYLELWETKERMSKVEKKIVAEPPNLIDILKPYEGSDRLSSHTHYHKA